MLRIKKLVFNTGIRLHATRAISIKNLVGVNVHGRTEKVYKDMPLFRRGGTDKKFNTGKEAAALLIKEARRRDPHDKTFTDTVEGVLYYINPLFEKDSKYAFAMKHLLEPERTIICRVPWTDKDGHNRINRAFRVQYNSTLGPMLGGIRFTKDLDLSLVRSLAFQQTLQNSLTGLPLGGSFGGADFDPQTKTANESRAFCWGFMTEMFQNFGAGRDIPCREQGCGSDAIGYLYGRYKRMTHLYDGGIAGKDVSLGGISLTDKAAGYGVVYFTKEMLKKNGHAFAGARCAISGSGSIALATAEKLIDSGAIPITLSDASGVIYCESGITKTLLQQITNLKAEDKNRTLADIFSISTIGAFFSTPAGKNSWTSAAMNTINIDYAFPCAASHSEIGAEEAGKLIKQGVKGVFEGSSMPCTKEAVDLFHHNRVLYAPSLACNAGAMICNSLEITQNVQRDHWTEEQMEERLAAAMRGIYNRCATTAMNLGEPHNIALGAYTTAFVRIADAMFLQGSV